MVEPPENKDKFIKKRQRPYKNGKHKDKNNSNLYESKKTKLHNSIMGINELENISKSVENMSGLSLIEMKSLRHSRHIQVVLGLNSVDFYPFAKFEDAKPYFPAGLLDYCTRFTQPSPIQSQCWPFILSGRDVVGIAETGSGKTLAFTFPMLKAIAKDTVVVSASLRKGAYPKALVMAPTRELAIQIHETLKKGLEYITESHIKERLISACIFGGVSKRDQSQELYNRNCPPSIVVGTPGRILDFLNEGAINLSSLSILVLDEADRMLDLGFEPDIRRIISFAPDKTIRQTLMFSATWPTSIRKLANEYLKEPVHIAIGQRGIHDSDQHSDFIDDNGEVVSSTTLYMPNGGITTLKGCSTIEQVVEVVEDPHEKDNRLVNLLLKYQKFGKSTDRIIIFALYKKEVDRIEKFLSRKGFQVGALHGDKSQIVRNEVLERFKNGNISLLIATDVAARGLDIPNVKVVLNYTFPLTIEDYVHRIGRTGRAGNAGIAHTFFTSLDKSHSGELIQVLKNSSQSVPQDLFKFGTTIKKKDHKDYGAHYREIDPTVKATHIKFDD